MNKESLTERDICIKYIVPAIQSAGWDIQHQVREEHFFIDSQVLMKGKTVKRGKRKFADFVLSLKPNMPLAIIEAKDNNHSVGSGMQQGLEYARTLDIPFVFSTNGDSFLFHDRLATAGTVEQELALDQFPSTAELWQRYRQAKGINEAKLPVITQDYYSDGSGRTPRYVTTSRLPSTAQWKLSAMDRSEPCWSWQQVPAKLLRPFNSFGDSGNPARLSGFCSWQTETFLSTKRSPMTLNRSVRP